MPILDNNPSFRYINIRNMVVIFEDRAYSINDMYTNQKYIYWDLKTPNDLIESNIKLDQTATRFWIIMNDKGTSTIIPQDRIIISGDKAQSGFGSGDVNSGEFQSLKQQVANNKEKYNILSNDVDGMKKLIGTEEELEDGSILKEIHSIKETATGFEREIREIQASVKDEYKEFRDKITATLIAMTTSLSEFKADINSFSYDSEITEAETITMNDDINKLISSYTDINTTLYGLISILEVNGETEYVNRINQYNRAIDTAMNNLINITRTAISDGETNSSEMTTIIGAIANTAMKISDMKALVDEIVTLGLGGTMYEEFSKLNMYKDKIQMEVHDVAKQGDTLKDTFAKFEIDSKSISQTVTSHTETINGMTTDLNDVKEKVNKNVSSIVPMYCLSDSSVQPSDNWTDIVPSSVEGKYIWTKTITHYADGSSSETEPINLTTSGSGSGAPGVGISKIEVWYYSSTSNVELLNGVWSTTKPENKNGRYIWTKHKIYYTDTSTMETAPLCSTGIPGNDGINPKTLRLVSSTYVVGYKVDNTPKEPEGEIELTAIQQNYTDEIIWTFEPEISTTGTGNKRRILFRDLAPYTSVTATITADGLEDSVTIYKVLDGDDGYTIVLSNENHTFRGGTKYAVAQSTTCDVIAYKGTKRVPCTIGEITGMPIGMTIPSHSNNGTTTARFTVEVATSMDTMNGVLNVPVTVEGVTINKTFSYTLALKGEDAKGIYLSADRYIIPFDEGGNLKNSKLITLNAKMDNLEGNLLWSVSPSTVELIDVSSNTKTIDPYVFKNLDTVEVAVSCNSYSDMLTLVKVIDGNGGYAVALSNESHIFSGNETSAEIGGTTCRVMGYKGEVRKNCHVGEIKNIPVGMEVSITNNNSIEPIISITVDNTMTTPNGMLDIPVVIDEKTFNKTFSYSIAYIGKTGVGVKKVDVEYILTDSPDTPPSSSDTGWQTTPPTWEMNKFIWSRNKTYYTNNNVVTTLPVMISGNPGEDAKALKLKASRYIIVYDKNGELKDKNDIVLNTVLENFADTVVWTTNPAVTLTGDNLQKSLSPSVFDTLNQVTISASASTLTDTLTIVKVVDGADGEPGTDGFNGYTVMLSNENHTFLGNEKNALAGEITIDVVAYCGTENIVTNIGSITGMPTGMTTEIINNGTNKSQIKIKVTTALTTKNGTIKIPIIADGKTFNKVFSYSVAIKGSDSKILNLTTNKNVVSFDANDNPKDTEDIVFAVNSQNLTGSLNWSVSPKTVSLTSISATKKKIPTTALIDNDSIKVTVSSEVDGISDMVTVVKVRDGARGTSINILNEYATEEELIKAHPTGNINDAYLVDGDLYVWADSKWTNVGRFKGKDGVDGISYYVHIKYSNDGESFTLNDGEDVGAYIGILTDTNKADSTVFSDYTWKKIEGENGLDGLNGEDAYTVILSNESHTFAGTSNYAIASETTCIVNGYKGSVKSKCTIGTITGMPTGMTVSISNNGTTEANFTVKVTNNMNTANGNLTIPVTIDGKVITKTFSYAIAFKGADSQTLNLFADKYVVPFKEDNTLKDTSVITLNAYPKNLSGTVSWSTTPNNISLGGSGNTRTINPNVFKDNNTVVVSVTLGGYNDKVTIVKIKDGNKGASGTNGTNGVNGDDAITIVLSNPSHTFMGDETKAKASSTTCKVIAYKGTTQKACKIGTITGMPTGMSITNNGTHYNNNTTGAYFKVDVTTEMTTGNGTLTVPVTCDGKTFNLMFSYSLALKGEYGTGVTEIVEEYAMNQDKNTAPTSGWSTTPPTWKEGYYLWTRSKITYKNPTSVTYTTPICDISWDAIKNIEIGGTNLVRKSDIKISNSTYTTGTFDDDSNTWTLTNTTGGTSTFGYGLYIANKNVITPYGQTCIISFEIKTPRNVTVNWDVNNYANSGSSWAGNDNDNTSLRKGSSKNIPANQWTKCWFSYTNTHASNTSKVDLYDNSNFGIVMTNETSNITYQIRNVKAELGTIPTAWSPCPLDIGYQIKTVSDIVATHTTDLESITGRVTSVEKTTSTLDGKITGLNKRVQTAESKITKDGITSTVGNYYTTKTQFDNQIATIQDDISKIEQKADSITSTVSKVAKGGSNILLNTRFEGAKPGGNICPEWGFHNGMHIYVNQGKKNYNKENTIYLGNSQNSVRGVLAQDISVNKVPKGTTVTLSFDISAENNVQGWGVGFDYYNSSWTHLKGQTLFKASSGNGHKSITLTTPTDIDYEHMQFYVYHEGSNNGATGYLVVIGNIMLEKGDVETVWQPSYQDVATKSLVTQTADEVRYEFKENAGENLIYNGDARGTGNAWTDNTGGAGTFGRYISDNLGKNFYKNTDGGGFTHDWIKLESDTEYFYTARIASDCDYNTNNSDLLTPMHCWCNNANTSGQAGMVILNHQQIIKRDKWVYCYIHFRTTSDSNIKFKPFIYAPGITGSYIGATDIMLYKGSAWKAYSPNPNEVLSNTTIINKDGVNVKHTNGSSTNLNATALNFYNSSNTLYAQVTNGVYKFWNGSNYIGYLGHAGWSTDTSKRNISFAGEYGNTLTLSAKKNSSDTNYQTWLVVSGHEQTISGVNYHQGVILIQPRVSGIMHFYGQGSMGDTYPGMIFASTDAHLAVMGDSYVDIGIQVGSSRYNGIRIDEISGNPYKVINMFGNLNMNGWSITNANMASSVSATSAQTYALRTMSDEESYSDPTAKAITDIFPSQTPTEGEIRWTDRETHFTSEVETGVYECYIEIPWWIAQNLENNYHVNITPVNGFYQYYVSERDPYYFTLKSDKDGMGFTFEIVGKLLDNNTTANNASVAGDQYLASDVKESETANIVTELDTADIITPDTTSDI